MQPENKFDQLSKGLAVAVSRRSLLRSLSVACVGVLWPWNKAFADRERPTSVDLETTFSFGPLLIDGPVAGKSPQRCIVSVKGKNIERFATASISASEAGECPTVIANYFEDAEAGKENVKDGAIDESEMYKSRIVDGRSRAFSAYPTSISFVEVNPITGKEEFEAFCSNLTSLDPRVHKGDLDIKMIVYRRTPTSKPLDSLEDEVTCGDINYAYENEIKTRKPIALRDFTVDAVPHQATAKRLNSTDASISNHSGRPRK